VKAPRPAPARQGWRPAELARAYGFPRSSIYAWIHAGELAAVRVGPGTLVVLASDWERFLAMRRTQPPTGGAA